MKKHTLLAPLFIAVLACAGFGCRARLSPADLTDPAITARVKATLAGHPELDVRYLQINTHMRIVTISGLIDSFEAKQKVETYVRNVGGVRQVVANLAVQE
ncbi:MAG: BON domain-containing protein [Elusimicrobia bacterium]|nr:BON domain-containing protein [Elusimicrobiota bacterium]